MVIELIGRGMGNEAELLARSRVLRARIEAPEADPAQVAPEPPAQPVTAEVQAALAGLRSASPLNAPRLDGLQLVDRHFVAGDLDGLEPASGGELLGEHADLGAGVPFGGRDDQLAPDLGGSDCRVPLR